MYFFEFEVMNWAGNWGTDVIGTNTDGGVKAVFEFKLSSDEVGGSGGGKIGGCKDCAGVITRVEFEMSTKEDKCISLMLFFIDSFKFLLNECIVLSLKEFSLFIRDWFGLIKLLGIK